MCFGDGFRSYGIFQLALHLAVLRDELRGFDLRLLQLSRELALLVRRFAMLCPKGLELGFGALLRAIHVFANRRGNNCCSLVDRVILGVIVLHS